MHVEQICAAYVLQGHIAMRDALACEKYFLGKVELPMLSEECAKMRKKK